MKARVGRMENRDVGVGFTIGKNKGFSFFFFFEVFSAVWAVASVTYWCREKYSVMQELICWIPILKACWMFLMVL